MQKFTRLTIVLLTALFLIDSVSSEESSQENFETIAGGILDGREYSFRITEDEIIPTPAWETNQEAPTLTPRAALKLARAFIDDFPHGKTWQLISISLEPFLMAPKADNRWIYVVTFQIFRGYAVDGLPVLFRVPVLMNGKIPKPVVTKWTP